MNDITGHDDELPRHSGGDKGSPRYCDPNVGEPGMKMRQGAVTELSNSSATVLEGALLEVQQQI